ncbi:MAG: cob(I)alamin adenosyltransferase [Candidatus Woesearchaeota archaeon]|nr:cob(I)alamin adenosyltransferase [Candidatus Woesearchaeota archaeon]MDN5327794.1 cob(I)alamin adenosyltransferase [Candidatus Woesearchaeota archaeon]
MKISTKKGDSGKSSTLTEKDVHKDSIIFEVVGTIDELNAFVGFARVKCNMFCKELKTIQEYLIKVNAFVACGGKNYLKDVEEFLNWLDSQVEKYEKTIELKNFIIFGDYEESSRLDLCRAVCRRCERKVVSLTKIKKTDFLLTKVFNRLSDLFFIYSVIELQNKKG